MFGRMVALVRIKGATRPVSANSEFSSLKPYTRQTDQDSPTSKPGKQGTHAHVDARRRHGDHRRQHPTSMSRRRAPLERLAKRGLLLVGNGAPRSTPPPTCTSGISVGEPLIR
eukprot:scaffold9600_cov65-Phaeocystis_antarctica.AAC.9